MLKWTHGLLSRNYRTATLSTLYITVSGINIQKLKWTMQLYHAICYRRTDVLPEPNHKKASL